MKKLYAILAALALLSQQATTQAFVDIVVDDITVNAGEQSLALNVTWATTTALDYLTTEFIITAIGSSPDGEVAFSTTASGPPMPPTSNPLYVFYNNSDDFINLPLSNPATVYQTMWANDTYNFADSTADSADQAQDGTRLWTILNIELSALAAGSYQITLGNSSYTNAANPGGLTPTMSGGLITVNTVPEPAAWALAAFASAALALSARRRKTLPILIQS